MQLLHQRNGAEDAEGGGEHYGAGEKDAEEDVDDALLEAHIEETGGKGACPGARARQRDADEEKQRDVEAPAGLRLKLLPAFFAFFKAPGEEFSDVFLVFAPFEDLAGEEIDERHRNHIADNRNYQ